MSIFRHAYFWALFVSVFVHAAALYLVAYDLLSPKKPEAEPPSVQMVYVAITPPPPPKNQAPLPPPASPPEILSQPSPPAAASAITTTERQPARMEAPPAPSAEEWALASTYTLKNSKRYRYNWGQQVRSMMGTAIEGPDQGVVRFRIEIAPDGRIVSIQTLWTTSEVAEKLAREAIAKMPPLPPTPNGKPLIFEQTISFQPFAADGPPNYQDDCLPDPPVYRNRFAWDGKSAKTQADAPKREEPDPAALAECMKQLPPETIESVGAHNERQFDQWRSKTLGH